MCGIIGFVGSEPCVNDIFSGLQKLEYRGYDSSGIAVVNDGTINVIKQKGKLSALEPLLKSLPKSSKVGMGHTRWATHGAPSVKNAHPHGEQRICIVHNGILDNYKELKIDLLEEGKTFISETDSEVIVHLLQNEIEIAHDLMKGILNIIPRLDGAYALGIMEKDHPEEIFIVKQASPLVIGLGEGENFFASDPLALLSHTNRFIFLEDGEIAKITKDEIKIWDFNGAEVEKDVVTFDSSEISMEKSGYRHYMIKEIHDQPSVLRKTINRWLTDDKKSLNFNLLGFSENELSQIKKIHIVACGTAYYAGMLGKYVIEPLVQKCVEVELASEFRYRNPFIDKDTLILSVTQSGETADTLACVKYAKSKGCRTLSICNVAFSSIPRESDFTVYMEAGPEIGVASTKAFTSMVLNFYFLGLGWGRLVGNLDRQTLESHLEEVVQLPNLIEKTLNAESLISEVAGHYFEEHNCLFVGRNFFYPLALEGALKLKEVSYIHAEGYAGGELKHGPIALVDKTIPILAIAPLSKDHSKMISNLEEIYAREGRIIGLGSIEDDKLRSLSKDLLPCPIVENMALQAIICSVPLQIFAYYVAVHRGTDVDQPRNLAKSVTVE